MKHAKAIAHSNIALIKYWGKRNDTARELNLPAVGSLSMTLDAFWTETEVGPNEVDSFQLDGETVDGNVAAKVFAHLDRVFGTRGRPRCAVRSTNHLPTAAGLASSASGFAALTMAANAAFGLDRDQAQLCSLARQGSGSAARSILGGFVRLDRGHARDGSDCTVRAVAPADHWPLRLVVVQTTRKRKPLGSTTGMERSAQTSPYYEPWVGHQDADLDGATMALADRDLARLGELVEHSCFKMHACMLATRPPILYWNGVTVDVIHAVWAAREEGLAGFVTIDAGPHVKVLTAASDAEALARRLGAVAGVHQVTVCAPGPDARIVEPPSQTPTPDSTQQEGPQAGRL